MRVEIYDLDGDGNDRVAGVLRLDNGVIVAEPDSALLHNILAEPIYDPRSGRMWDSERTPKEFLESLHRQYTSAYLRASRVME